MLQTDKPEWLPGEGRVRGLLWDTTLDAADKAELLAFLNAHDAILAERARLRAGLERLYTRMRWQQGGGQTVGAGVYYLVLSVDDREELRATLEGVSERG